MERGADFAGWGKKQGSRVKTWKKRFFVLRGRELVYYSGSESSADEKGRLTVLGVDFAPDLKNGLLIRGEKKNKTQVLKMKADTADESKAWLLTIRQAVAEPATTGAFRSESFRSRSVSGGSSSGIGIDIGTRSSSVSSAGLRSSSVSSANNNASSFFGAMSALPPVPERSFASQRSLSVPSDAPIESYRRDRSLSATPGEKRGWLLKEGRTVKSWKKRFFVLRGNVLTYYENETSSPKLGAVVVRAVETNFTTPFTLDVHAEGGRLLRIAADSLDDIEQWDLALAQAITAAASSSDGSKTRAASLSTAASSVASPTAASSNDSFTAFEQHSNKVQYRLESQASSSLYDSEPTDWQQQQQSPSVQHVEPNPWRRTASMSASARPSCDGWLLKQGHRTKQWKRRFFTLTDASLEYRHTPHDVPNEDENVVAVAVETLRDRHGSTTAVAHIELDSGRTITVAGESPSEFARWVNALRVATGESLVGDGDDGADDDGNQALHEVDTESERKQRGDLLSEPLNEQPQVAVTAPPQSIIKYGWLRKQGARIKSWKRRYFVLEGDALTYFDRIDKPARGGGIVARVVRDPAGDACGLDIHLASGRVLKVAAETADDLEAWYTALHTAAQLLPRSALDASESLQLPLQSPSSRTLGQRGWLLKCGQTVKSWKLRYFVLERSRLTYYSSDAVDATDDDATTAALGSGVVFDVAVGDARPLSLDVQFQNGRLLQLAASDEAQFRVWLHALQTASNLTESFLSQPDNDAAFDLDDGRDDDVASQASDASMGLDAALDWSVDNQDTHDDDDATSGYATWDAAMANKPEFEASMSSSSSDDEDDSERVAAATEALETAVVAAAEPMLAGWLNKQGGTVKTWKRRYFSLHGTTLRYFKSERGALLRAFTIARVIESLTLPLGLEITTTTDRTLVVTAESKDEYARWLAGLQAALQATSVAVLPVAAALAASSPSPSAPSTPISTTTATVATAAVVAIASAAVVTAVPIATGVPVAAAVPPSTVPVTTTTAATATAPAAVDLGTTVNAEGKTVTTYSGWLEKEGQRFKTWKRRYFTYKRGALLYFSDVGAVALGHGVVTSVRVDASKAFTLCIQLEHDRVLRVSAASADDMNTWLRVLATDSPLLSPTRGDVSQASSPAVATLLSPVAKLVSPVAKLLSPKAHIKATTDVPAAPAPVAASPATTTTPSTLSNRGAVRERVSDRDPSDYLANDTISNESFLRIQDEQFRRHGDSEAVDLVAARSFKGDLDFGMSNASSTSDRAAKLQLATERAESEEDLAYYRELLAESEREREKRETEKAESGAITGCAPCCIVM